jgi:hypothetical protein
LIFIEAYTLDDLEGVCRMRMPAIRLLSWLISIEIEEIFDVELLIEEELLD